MYRFRTLFLSLLLVCPASAETIRVGAAISLKEALTAIAKEYEAAGGDTIEFSFGSSGQVLAQIKSGAEIDVFISAANKQVDDLAKAGLVDAATRKVIARNTLVLIVPAGAKDAPDGFAALGAAGVGKIAIGSPETVPAGQYAQQTFAALKLTDAVAARLVYGTNVRQVLTYVERGEVAAGVVYATDAREAGDKVRVVATAGETTHEPIVYPAVVVTASRKQDAAKKFLARLGAAPAQRILAARGFSPPEAPATVPSDK